MFVFGYISRCLVHNKIEHNYLPKLDVFVGDFRAFVLGGIWRPMMPEHTSLSLMLREFDTKRSLLNRVFIQSLRQSPSSPRACRWYSLESYCYCFFFISRKPITGERWTKDDIVVAHRDLGVIKRVTAMGETFLLSKNLEVNANETKPMKFRRGGCLAVSDDTRCGGQRLKFMKSFSSLSLRVHFTGTNFTENSPVLPWCTF